MSLTRLIYNTSKENDREQWRCSLAGAGLSLVNGSFEEGATVNSTTDVVWHISGGQCYAWYGELPKDIPAGTTPVGVAAWEPQTDLKDRWLYEHKLQRTDPFGDIKSDGAAAISTALTNLGLGEAAKRAVGTGENQIPDMSSFPLTVTGDLISRKLTTKLPNGLILKAVNGDADYNGWFSLNFDTPFPSEILFCWAADRLPISAQNQLGVINANINLSTVDHVAGYARAITIGGGVGPVAASISAYALGR